MEVLPWSFSGEDFAPGLQTAASSLGLLHGALAQHTHRDLVLLQDRQNCLLRTL